MKDTDDLVIVIKQIIKETVETFKPSEIFYGEVTKASPIEIQIDQKISLDSMQIIIPQHLTDWDEKIKIDWTSTKHNHDFNGEGSVVESDTNLKGEYQIKHLNSLKVGDKVILLRKPEGQKYLVVDRV